MRKQRKPRHRRGRDGGFPYRSHMRLPTNGADGWVNQDSDGMRQECNEIRNRDIPMPYSSNTAFKQLSSKGRLCATSGSPLILSATCAHTSRECRLPVGVSAGESVNLSSPVCIIIGSRLNQTIEFVNNLTASHYHNTDATHAGASAIGCFKVYCYKVLHRLFISNWL
jgi:hypothetical protein